MRFIGSNFGTKVPSRLMLFLLSLSSFLILTPHAKASVVYSIADNAAGGDCVAQGLGTWDPATKTCTLTHDVSVSITDSDMAFDIAGNGLTLNGAGHTIAGNGYGNGVGSSYYAAVNIKNLAVTGFSYGMAFSNSNNGSATDNLLTSNRVGIILSNSSSNSIFHNNISASIYQQMSISGTSTSNIVSNNYIHDSNADAALAVGGSANLIRNNYIVNNHTSAMSALYVTGSNNNIFGNTVSNNLRGINLYDTSHDNAVYNNNIIGNTTQAGNTGSGNAFNKSLLGGNFWSDHYTPDQGCVNANNDSFCDSPYSPAAGVTDNMPLTRRGYYFTWYDMASPGVKNWILMANPVENPDGSSWFDLSIASIAQTLPTAGGSVPGQVASLSSITPSFPGVMNGPVAIGYHAPMSQMVSQRILWGDSLEEVTGVDSAKLSDHYYWSWYDMKSAGFSNWILIDNPSATDTVTASISFKDHDSGADVYQMQNIAPGGRWTPTFPGKMGGPVEVRSWVLGGSWDAPANRRSVIASQRVLTNGDTAFNEVPAVAAGDLKDRYEWTWYDQQSPGALNWILIANPAMKPDGTVNTDLMDYSIFIGGAGAGGGTSLPPGNVATVMFPGKMNGPVELFTVKHNSGTPLESIASQRVIWGASFEEVPGQPYAALASAYYWTWYDMKSPGVSNWVLLANPDPSEAVHYEISIAGQLPAGGCSSGLLGPGAIRTCVFPGNMAGPVKVQAWNATKTAPKNVITSQRVIWKGYFNEVMGTALN